MSRGSGPDLFAAAVEERLANRAPLAARLRPRSLSEVVGQQHLLGAGKSLRVLIESDRLSSLVLWGPPGTGKTTIARLVAGGSSKAFQTLSAVRARGKDLREVAEVAHALAVERESKAIALQDAEAALALRSVHYGDDEHYDIVSAFIKSIRGSDPDAGLYWLARMLEAGEDARFVARRLVILASEDVGFGDPHAILVAEAAARAVAYVGLPAAALNLPHAVIHLPPAPPVDNLAA